MPRKATIRPVCSQNLIDICLCSKWLNYPRLAEVEGVAGMLGARLVVAAEVEVELKSVEVAVEVEVGGVRKVLEG